MIPRTTSGTWKGFTTFKTDALNAVCVTVRSSNSARLTYLPQRISTLLQSSAKSAGVPRERDRTSDVGAGGEPGGPVSTDHSVNNTVRGAGINVLVGATRSVLVRAATTESTSTGVHINERVSDDLNPRVGVLFGIEWSRNKVQRWRIYSARCGCRCGLGCREARYLRRLFPVRGWFKESRQLHVDGLFVIEWKRDSF